jgi:Rps23 Pro-64 3,4-dihydroxylase Tpa1-like proline 4-hydroxylase
MTRDVQLHLNPALDPAEFAEIYARDGLVQIPGVLPDDAAEAIFEVLRTSVSWRLVFPEPGGAGMPDRIVYIDQAEAARLGQAGLQAQVQSVMARARNNYGFLYNVYPMVEAYVAGWDAGHPIHTLTEFLNSVDFLEFGRQVIGAEAITKADAQATLYAPGHFLTRHVDEGANLERRAAYTFGFTKSWQTDWGGLLMFLDDQQDISRALMPRFNVLTLFDGTKIHSVSPVSAFAGGHRLQITGWLRDDPPDGAGQAQPLS